MEKRVKQLIANYSRNVNQPAKLDDALAWFVNHIDQRCRYNIILSDVRPSRRPGRNKRWQIELLFNSVSQRNKRGFFACHDSKHFMSYSFTLEDRDYWFDNYDSALNFLQFEEAEAVV